MSQAIAAAGPNPPPASLSTEPILGETLAVISYNWLAEVAAQQLVGDQIAQVTTQYHHGVGITAQAVIRSTNFEGPYVDLPMNFLTLGQQTCWPTTPSIGCPITLGQWIPAFLTTADASSSLELAVLEQTQAQISMVAASTIRLLDMNIASGPSNGRTFFADGTTAAGQAAYNSSIRPSLVTNGYCCQSGGQVTDDLLAIDGAVASGKQLVLPIQGNILVGQHWIGAGYTVLDYTHDTQGNVTGIEITQKISGGLSGGFSGLPDLFPENLTEANIYAAQQEGMNNLIYDLYSASHVLWSEPVDAISGAYLYKNTDLTTGSGAFPYALPFGRTYVSGSSTVDLGMGNGWAHSYSLKAATNSDPYQGFGSISPISGASAIAAIYVAQDLLTNTLGQSSATNAQHTAIAAVVTRWLTDQLTNNLVIVTLPDTTEQYVWLPHQDNATTITYNPPPGSSVVLNATGTTYTYAVKDGTRLTFQNFQPAGSQTQFSAVSGWTWPNGMQVNFSYDTNGNLTKVANSLGRSLSFAYMATQVGSTTVYHLTGVTDDTGRSISYAYDSTFNLISSTDPLGLATRFVYDGNSRITQVFYPSHPSIPFVTNVYDGLGRVAQQANANGAVSLSYISGPRTELIDPAGDRHITYQTSLGSVTTDAWVLSPTFGNVYNDTPQQTGVNVTTNQYDGLNRRKSAKTPEGGVTQYIYSLDLLNNVIQIVRTAKPGSPLPQQTTNYTYDPTFNKPTSITDPLGLVTTMAYDFATGNLLSAVADAGAAPHFNARSSFTYNGVGQVLTTTDPLGIVTQYGYDARGNPTSVVRDVGPGHINQAVSMTYSALGDVTSVTDPNGNVTTRTYDAKRNI